MTGSLLEELDENQLNSPQLIDRSVAELSATQITDLAARLSDSAHLSTVGQPDDLFSFVPNSSIGASFNRRSRLAQYVNEGGRRFQPRGGRGNKDSP